MTDNEFKQLLVDKYKYLNEENAFVEFTTDYICVNWYNYMDCYIRMDRIKQICNFIKKHKTDNRPVMDALCRIY